MKTLKNNLFDTLNESEMALVKGGINPPTRPIDYYDDDDWDD